MCGYLVCVNLFWKTLFWNFSLFLCSIVEWSWSCVFFLVSAWCLLANLINPKYSVLQEWLPTRPTLVCVCVCVCVFFFFSLKESCIQFKPRFLTALPLKSLFRNYNSCVSTVFAHSQRQIYRSEKHQKSKLFFAKIDNG